MLAGLIAGAIFGTLGGFFLGWAARKRPPALPQAALPRELPPARALVPTVEEEIARAMRQGPPLALFFLAWETQDPADPTLKLLESMLVRLVRPYDAIVPLGEGEFVLVLPQVGEGAADTVASRMIQELGVLASVRLTSSESELPRISLAPPAGVRRLLDAARSAASLAPPWRGERGQRLRIGLAVLERAEVPLLGHLRPGTVLRLQEKLRGLPAEASALRVELLDAGSLRCRNLDPVFRSRGERVQIILEQGHSWKRADVEVLEADGAELRLSPPQEVHRLPRRRAERFRLRVAIRLADLEGFTLNLSADGFRAAFPVKAFAPGQVLDGRLALPDGPQPVRVEVIKLRAAERSAGMIVGCRFLELDPQARHALARALSEEPEGGSAC